MNYYLAIDIGASSGRHILGWIEDGRIETQEVYRFENGMIPHNGHKCWDTKELFHNIVEGMKACKAEGKVPTTMAIDTWGVDFVLLDENDEMVGDAVAYRDKRNKGMDKEVERILSFEELYKITGIQKQPFNTVYQLMAIKKENPEHLEKAQSLLMTPDYYQFLLTGVKKQEYTMATTGALVNAESKEWDRELIERLGYPARLFGPLSKPGTTVGGLTPEMQKEVGYDCTVVLACTHDTGSAYMAVPAKDENAVYLSSGTWSLLGIESLTPIITEAGLDANFANEGGYDYRFRFLKNIMGLWMIQSIRRNYDKKYSFMELEEMAKEAAYFTGMVDVDDEDFLAPDSMVEAIKAKCVETGQPVPGTVGELMQCVYISLAECYKKAILNLQKITGRTFTSINIVGGGCKDGYLDGLTAKATGLPVYAGPSEGTVIGNLMAQMLAAGEYKDLAEARKAVAGSFKVKKYEP